MTSYLRWTHQNWTNLEVVPWTEAMVDFTQKSFRSAPNDKKTQYFIIIENGLKPTKID